MKERVKKIFIQYCNVIPYLFFGVLTTLINVASYWFAAHILKAGTMPSTIFAWTLAVLFAYFTNRKWVFFSEAKSKEEIIKELVSFYTCRLATGIIDWLCMYVFVDCLHFDDVMIKILANLLVIILNYLASKLVIFRKNRDKKLS